MRGLRQIMALLRHGASMMVGMPNYANYCRHMAEHHPDGSVMSEVEFFRNRQEARYGGKGNPRCC